MNIILINDFGFDVANIILEYTYNQNIYNITEKRLSRKLRHYNSKLIIEQKSITQGKELRDNLQRYHDLLDYRSIAICLDTVKKYIKCNNYLGAYKMLKRNNEIIYDIAYEYLDE